MYTSIKLFKESLLVPRNIEGRQAKLKEQNYKLLQQEIIDGNLTIDETFDFQNATFNVKQINGDVYLMLNYQPEWLKQVNINGNLFCGKNTNDLKVLDLSNYVDLKQLTCTYNKLTSLDLSTCINLTTLNCHDNQLTSLDLSKCINLIRLYCYDNQLTSLDISGCKDLTRLYCNGNKLTSLDISNCTNVETLYCYDNQLTTIDLSNNLKLTDKSIDDNVKIIE